jgi:hypothetical protein
MSPSEPYFPRWLRSEAKTDPLFARIRDLVREKGVDADSIVIADFFPDDTSLYFGVLVMRERRAFTFDYDYLRRPELEGELSEWRDITATWATSPYHKAVAAAFAMLDAAT